MNDTIINYSSSFFNFTNPNGTQPTITTITINVHDVISQICSQYNNWTIYSMFVLIIVDIIYLILLRPKYKVLRGHLFWYEPQEIIVFNLIMIVFILVTMTL